MNESSTTIWSRVLPYTTIACVTVLFAGLVCYGVGSRLIARATVTTTGSSDPTLQAYQAADGSSCNIAVVPLDGELFVSQLDATAGSGSAANDVVAQIEQATNDDSIKGIVLRINSPGGSPVGGEMIAQALRAAGKPTVALIQDLGDSAAYFAATGGDWIIASPFSDVGDIGVTSSYVDNSKADTKNGQTFVQISTGKYKDAGNPDKMLTDDERALLQKNVDEAYATLVDEIALNRSMPTSTVKALANGASMPASEAIGKGLVDELGGATAAREWFVTKLADKDVTLCRILQ